MIDRLHDQNITSPNPDCKFVSLKKLDDSVVVSDQEIILDSFEAAWARIKRLQTAGQRSAAETPGVLQMLERAPLNLDKMIEKFDDNFSKRQNDMSTKLQGLKKQIISLVLNELDELSALDDDDVRGS